MLKISVKKSLTLKVFVWLIKSIVNLQNSTIIGSVLWPGFIFFSDSGNELQKVL